MKAHYFIFLATSTLMTFCTANPTPPEISHGTKSPTVPPSVLTQEVSSTPDFIPTADTLKNVQWNIYDPDPGHLWNRIFRQFYRRTSNDGQEFGWDSLDPLLWYDTTYLLEGNSYEEAIAVLDEFLSTKGEDLITNPLQRAIFQRDLWAVFDRLILRSDTYPIQRRELQRRLGQVIRKVALTEDQILLLTNNYELAIKSGLIPASYMPGTPEVGFLPMDLLDPKSEWVCLGREGGPIALSHTEGFPFFGRSVFLVFIRVPGGREATLKFLQELNQKQPFTIQLASTEVALVRQAVLINNQGNIIPSPIIESVQLRHFLAVDKSFTVQNFYEFQLNRAALFAGTAGGFQPVTEEFALFSSHGDMFPIDSGLGRVEIPSFCANCHPQFEGGFTLSILSYSRFRFPLPDQSSPVLIQTTPDLEARIVATWKQKHPTWQALETFIK
jgi:hypothetical protein